MGCVLSKRREASKEKAGGGGGGGGVQSAATAAAAVVHDGKEKNKPEGDLAPAGGQKKKKMMMMDPWSYDSGELRRLAPAEKKSDGGKVPETSSILGRASIAGLKGAVEVLDTLGSSMSSLNTGGGFAAGMTSRGNKISILAFEVANTIAKGANLWRSLSDENIKLLKEDISQSDGIRKLVYDDPGKLLHVAATDKREEIDLYAREVIRFGDLCKDPVWHNLGRYFEKLNSDVAAPEQSKQEVEEIMQALINMAQNTSELYHELHTLDRLEQDYKRKLEEEEEYGPATRRETLLILNSELKRQRKVVKNLKKRSLWSRNLEEIVEKLADVVSFLYNQVRLSFENAGTNRDYQPAQYQGLGASGLALHYANVISQIDSIVSRPLSLLPTTRDSLYHGLPPRVKASLRSRLQSFDAKEEFSVAEIKAEMQKTLRWIIPIAENTIRIHQGFGWVGEWANMGSEINKKSDPQHNINRIQTLYHANKEKTEECILELVVWLHHLVVQVKNRGYGLKSLNSVSNEPQKETAHVQEAKKDLPHINVVEVSEEERQILEFVSSRRPIFGRSKSLDSDKKGVAKSRGLNRSCGNSPNREFSISLDLQVERSRVLDVMDGLDTLDAFPIVSFNT